MGIDNATVSDGTSMRIIKNRGLTTKRSGAMALVYATRGNRGARCAVVTGHTTTRSNDVSTPPRRPIMRSVALVRPRSRGDNITF